LTEGRQYYGRYWLNSEEINEIYNMQSMRSFLSENFNWRKRIINFINFSNIIHLICLPVVSTVYCLSAVAGIDAMVKHFDDSKELPVSVIALICYFTIPSVVYMSVVIGDEYWSTLKRQIDVLDGEYKVKNSLTKPFEGLEQRRKSKARSSVSMHEPLLNIQSDRKTDQRTCCSCWSSKTQAKFVTFLMWLASLGTGVGIATKAVKDFRMITTDQGMSDQTSWALCAMAALLSLYPVTGVNLLSASRLFVRKRVDTAGMMDICQDVVGDDAKSSSVVDMDSPRSPAGGDVTRSFLNP